MAVVIAGVRRAQACRFHGRKTRDAKCRHSLNWPMADGARGCAGLAPQCRAVPNSIWSKARPSVLDFICPQFLSLRHTLACVGVRWTTGRMFEPGSTLSAKLILRIPLHTCAKERKNPYR